MFERFNLKDTAFPVTPGWQDGIKWYGFSKLQKKLKESIQRSMLEAPRVCILNRGPIGSGKTHAANYFSEETNLNTSNGLYSGVVSYVVEAPKEGSGAFYDLFKRIMNAITFAEVAKSIAVCRESIGQNRLQDKLMRVIQNEDVTHVLTHVDEENILATRTYLYGSAGVRDMKSLGVAARLTSGHEFAAVLKGIFWLIINGIDNPKRPLRRLVLWIDEMEDLVYYPTKYYLPFTHSLRELIDSTSEHLTLFLNFTFTEPEDLETIESVLGEAIISRVNDHVLFKESTEEDVRLYLLDLLADNHTGKGPYQKTAPFDEDAFEYIVTACSSHTPRYINKLCDKLLRSICSEFTAKQTGGAITLKMLEARLLRIAEKIE